jgi:hypothetical protein
MHLLPAESGKPDPMSELAQSRLDGESDVQFWERYTRQKYYRYEELAAATATFRANGSNSEVIRRAETAQRQAAFYLEGATQRLYESICEAFKHKPLNQESQ